MEVWYFETSAVNFLMQSLSVEDALATKQFQLNKGRDWRLSAVTLWEILMTSDEVRREEILYFCQHLFGRELLPSPAELIVPYIRQGMPKIENFRDLKSTSIIAGVWRELVDDRNKTFMIDHSDLRERAKSIQLLTKNVHELIKNGDLIIGSDKLFAGLDCSLSNLVKELPFIKSGESTSREQLLSYKVALYYIIVILCAEADVDNQPIKDFWQKLRIDSISDRISYVLKYLPTLVHRGPFCVMAYMTISQASGKYPRGVWLDSLHSIYMTYVDRIFTTDGHFQGLRDIIPEPILQQKIHHMDEVDLTRHNFDQFGMSHK
ncbi:hypothetical protein WG68_10385 [Arsukibacterium ikkense]|uniref:Uncharacterized protein n=1 Tax=Arsukibacterium ikkense TaxID=336831 RepID=A0A0M2V3L0_9GAMM|nr:hypothetical protein [Arsukibacterium ikkense]KKO45447.1 hypothetical protein WG68_10385 [Arsukibacterium ikkense]